MNPNAQYSEPHKDKLKSVNLITVELVYLGDIYAREISIKLSNL